MATVLRTPGTSRLKTVGPTRPLAESAPPQPVPPELTRRLAENFGTMTPFGWPMLWQAFQNSSYPGGPAGSPYRGASGTTNDRSHGKDIPFFWSEVDLRGYRVTSRYLAETNPFAIGFCNLLVGYHVRKGYGWQACKKGAQKTPYPTAQKDEDPVVAKAQRILDEFRDVNLWPVLSREAFYRWRVDGEVFLRIGARGKLIWARFVEPEQVGAPDGSTTDPWSYGIEVLEYDDGKIDPGTILSYHVWDLESGMTEGEWVEEPYIVHAKANVASGVKRGRPDFFPVLDLFDNTRRLWENMLLTAVDQAAIAWIEQFPSATGDQVRTLVPEQAIWGGQTVPAGDQSCGTWGAPWWRNQSQTGKNYRPGTIMRAEGNRQFTPRPDSPISGFMEIEKLAMRTARMRWNLPGSASGDAEDTTFAAAIQAGGPFPVAVEGSQLSWGACFERPSALKVLDRATECGLLTREDRAQLDVEVTEPAVVTPEPDKDTTRRYQLNQAKVLSVTTWQLQEGLDPQHEEQNFKAEAERAQQQQPQQPGTPPGNTPPGGVEAAGGWQSGEELLGESVVAESGFTGTITDTAGRKRQYVDGKQVAGPAEQDADEAGNVPWDKVKPPTDQKKKADKPPWQMTVSELKSSGTKFFRTAQGSLYAVHPSTGQTIRVKSQHAAVGHDPKDVGLKAASAKTVYVDPKVASALSSAGLSGPDGKVRSRVVIKDGKATLLIWNERSGKWGSAPSGTNIPLHSTPAVGLAPLELWHPRTDIPGYEAFAGMHAGNAITAEVPAEAAHGEFVRAARTKESRLSEADHRGLVKKTITNRVGHKQTVWVRSDPGNPGTSTPAHKHSDGSDPQHTAPSDRRTRHQAGAEHYLATARERPQPKHVAAARTLTDTARRRRVIHAVKNEGELAQAIGGHNLPDSEPADVVHMLDAAGQPITDNYAIKGFLKKREESVRALKTGTGATGQPLSDAQRAAYEAILATPAHFFEVKTLLTSPKGAVHMSAKALARKERWMDKYGVSFSVVAIDDRRGSKHSGHRVYIAPHELGGTTRLDKMKPVEMSDVLKAVQ